MTDFLNFAGEFECCVESNEWKISFHFFKKLNFYLKKKIMIIFQKVPKELSHRQLNKKRPIV